MSGLVHRGPNPPAGNVADVEQGNDGGAVGAASNLAVAGFKSWWIVSRPSWTIMRFIGAMIAIGMIIEIYYSGRTTEAFVRVTETARHFFFVSPNRTRPSFAPVSAPQPIPGLAPISPPQYSPGFSPISPPRRSPGVPSASPPKTSPKLGSDNDGGVDADFGALGVPWCRSKTGQVVEWTAEDLLKGLKEFVPIYETRPITDTTVMGFDHSFGLWFIAGWVKPEVIIDLGDFRGYSTWLLRQAMPETPIILLSTDHPNHFLALGRSYTDENCFHLKGSYEFDFVSWKMMLEKEYGISDCSRVLLYFDDDRNQLKRIKQAVEYGFRHLVFEDNHDTGTGGHYSLRQICDQFYIKGGGHSCFDYSDEARIRAKRKKFWEKAVALDELCGPGEAWWGVKGEMRDLNNMSHRPITHSLHLNNSRYVESVLDLYWELPPVAGPSLTHQTRYDPARTSRPIIEDGDYRLFEQLGLNRLNTSMFNRYNQMVYVQLSPASS